MIWEVSFVAVLLRGPRGPLHFNPSILFFLHFREREREKDERERESFTIAVYKVALQCTLIFVLFISTLLQCVGTAVYFSY